MQTRQTTYDKHARQTRTTTDKSYKETQNKHATSLTFLSTDRHYRYVTEIESSDFV